MADDQKTNNGSPSTDAQGAGVDPEHAQPSSMDRTRATGAAPNRRHWFAQNSKSVIFLIIVLAFVGGYLALTIPVSVFPSTDFPRIVIAIDNGVMPIDQINLLLSDGVEIRPGRIRREQIQIANGLGNLKPARDKDDDLRVGLNKACPIEPVRMFARLREEAAASCDLDEFGHPIPACH